MIRSLLTAARAAFLLAYADRLAEVGRLRRRVADLEQRVAALELGHDVDGAEQRRRVWS